MTIANSDFRANSPPVDQVGVVERANRFTTRSIKGDAKMAGLKMVLNMIDLTTLEGMDTDGKVKQLCYKARHLHDAVEGLPTVAAVCVYPNFVGLAKKEVAESGIKVASVATAFPSGNTSLEIKLDDVKMAVDQGADEIDMVISRGQVSSRRLSVRLRRNRGGQGSLRQGPSENDSGNGRTRNVRQRSPRQRYCDRGGC